MTIKFSVMFTGMNPMNKYVPWAQKLEKHGFDEIYIADDLIYRPAWPIVTSIGANTSTIKVGPVIVNPITAHPVYHATNLLALDEITNGRALCGLGKGAFAPNLKIPDPEKPVRMIKEAYFIMKHIMAGTTAAFEGDYFNTAEGFRLDFEPLRKDIPILIGTWGAQMSRMAGRYSAGLIAACCSGQTMKRLVDETKAGALAGGRDPESLEIVAAPFSAISQDEKAARRIMTDVLGMFLPTMPLLTGPAGITDKEVAKIHKHALAGEFDAVSKLISDDAIREFSLTGSPKQVIPQIEEQISLGVNHINFTPPVGPDVDESIDLIAEHIIPYFR